MRLMLLRRSENWKGVEWMRDWNGDADAGLTKIEQEWMATDAGWNECFDECCSGNLIMERKERKKVHIVSG